MKIYLKVTQYIEKMYFIYEYINRHIEHHVN